MRRIGKPVSKQMVERWESSRDYIPCEIKTKSGYVDNGIRWLAPDYDIAYIKKVSNWKGTITYIYFEKYSDVLSEDNLIIRCPLFFGDEEYFK